MNHAYGSMPWRSCPRRRRQRALHAGLPSARPRVRAAAAAYCRRRRRPPPRHGRAGEALPALCRGAAQLPGAAAGGGQRRGRCTRPPACLSARRACCGVEPAALRAARQRRVRMPCAGLPAGCGQHPGGRAAACMRGAPSRRRGGRPGGAALALPLPPGQGGAPAAPTGQPTPSMLRWSCRTLAKRGPHPACVMS